MEFAGTPSDQLLEVLATGASDARFVFFSLSSRDPDGRDADYIAWHSLDHRPEQYRLAGIRNSIRLVSTPACRAARAANAAPYDAVDHIMTYQFAETSSLPDFTALGAYVLIEQGNQSPEALVDAPGVAGIWWWKGSAESSGMGGQSAGKQITYCFLDEDPVSCAATLAGLVNARWTSGAVTGLLAAPFYTVVPFEWTRNLPAG